MDKFNGWSSPKDYMTNKRAKLIQQEAELKAHVTKSKLFEGIRVNVPGHTDPSPSEICKIVREHGGSYVQSRRSEGIRSKGLHDRFYKNAVLL